MTQPKTKLLVFLTLTLGATAALVPLVVWTSRVQASESVVSGSQGGQPVVTAKTPLLLAVNNPASRASQPLAVTTSEDQIINDAAILNDRHRFALGMIETDNNDDEIGGAGEVSRYQIMPSVWRHYSSSMNYQNPEVSLAVAQKHWTTLYNTFKRQAHREPTDFDMYVLWNTRYGYYASRGFKPSRLNSVVRDRAERFANLVERGNS